MDAQPLESHLRRRVVDLLKRYKLYYESKPPMGMGASGLDLSVNLAGRWLSIEVKRSPKHDMTTRQASIAHQVLKGGGLFVLVRSDDDLHRLEEIINIQLGAVPEAKTALLQQLLSDFEEYVKVAFMELGLQLQREHIARLYEQGLRGASLGQAASYTQAQIVASSQTIAQTTVAPSSTWVQMSDLVRAEQARQLSLARGQATSARSTVSWQDVSTLTSKAKTGA